jgi:hypothetical protein
MGSTSKSSGTQQSQTSYDPQLKDAFLGNYANAQKTVAEHPGQAYSGPLSADFSQTALPAAQKGFGDLSGYNGSDVSSFFSPYKSNVIDTTLSDLMRLKGQSDVNSQSQATAAHAFGGSRSAVLQDLADQDWRRTAASTVANLENQGYTNAQQASQQAAGVRQNANASLAGIGQAQQQQQQTGVDASYQEWLRQQNIPFMLQQLLNQSAGLLPNGTVGTSSGTSKSSSFAITPPNISVAAGGGG